MIDGDFMRYLGSKIIETERLILKPQSMNEQRRLWEILLIPEVNKYFLVIPKKFKDNLFDCSKQEKFYEAEMEHSNDLDVFKWSIFLKSDNTCIGRLSCHSIDNENDDIRDVGWIIDPKYQRLGYAYEAAKAMLDYMFSEVGIKEIRTAAAVENPASWKLMEKLGFQRLKEMKMIDYTFLDELVEAYTYGLRK